MDLKFIAAYVLDWVVNAVSSKTRVFDFLILRFYRGFGGMSSVAFVKDFLAQNSDVEDPFYRLLDEEVDLVYELPETGEEKIHWMFTSGRNYTLPERFVCAFSNAESVGYDAVLMDGGLLEDVSPFFGALTVRHPVYSKRVRRNPVKTAGVSAFMGTCGGEAYYHWLFDVLPKVDLLERAGFGLGDIDNFVFNPLRHPFQRETLDILGVPLDRVVECSSYCLREYERLVVPRISKNPHPLSVDFLRRTFMGDVAEGGPSRIYVSRERCGCRRVLNEGEVFEALEELGFVKVVLEDYGFLEQVGFFNNVDVVVSPHGSGLSNLVFSRPKTKVVEFFSPSYVNVIYWAFSNLLGLDYYYLLGQGTNPPDFEDPHMIKEDIRVDVEKLKKTVSLALDSKG